MYKITVILTLICLSLVPAFQLGIIYGFYALNKAQVTDEHCVNIDKPALMCSGKCYVSEIITKSAERDGSSAPMPAVEDLRPITPLCSELAALLPLNAKQEGNPLPAIFSEAFLQRLYSAAIFKPPRA